MSELLRRLGQQLQQASDPLSRAELIARQAAYFARVGRFEETRILIADLRKSAALPGFERIAIWIILCEGILEHFSMVSLSAHDRVMRAQRLSEAFRDPELIPITAAWRAFVEFERSNFLEMSRAAKLALTSAKANDHETLARVGATLSYSFALAGNRELAQSWFESSRRHAVEAGDQATLEALMHNRASFSLASCRIAACLKSLNIAEVAAVRLEIASAKNFQKLIGLQSLTHLNDLCSARLLILESRFGEAADALAMLEGRGPFSEANFGSDILSLERSYCLAKAGRIDEALKLFSQVEDIELTGLDPDDRMIGANMHLLLTTADHRFGCAEAALARFKARQADFDAFRYQLLDALKQFSSTSC